MNLPPNLIDAIRDYSMLLEKGYPEKRTLTLIADRFQLDRHQRAVLFRGVFRKNVADKRRQKRLFRLERDTKELHVDLLNQLYTVNSYLEGRLVFVAMDGVLRDAAEMHGGPVAPAILERTLELVLKFLSHRPDLSVVFYLDEKPDIRQSVRAKLEAQIDAAGLPYSVVLTDAVDQILSDKTTGVLATSDSTIVDRTEQDVFDLAWWIIQSNFGPKIPDLRSILP